MKQPLRVVRGCNERRYRRLVPDCFGRPLSEQSSGEGEKFKRDWGAGTAWWITR
jgi:hypothetical protein